MTETQQIIDPAPPTTPIPAPPTMPIPKQPEPEPQPETESVLGDMPNVRS